MDLVASEGTVAFETRGSVHLLTTDGGQHIFAGNKPVLLNGFLFFSSLDVILRTPTTPGAIAGIPLETMRGEANRPVVPTHAKSPQNDGSIMFVDKLFPYSTILKDGGNGSVVMRDTPQRGAYFVDVFEAGGDGKYLVLTDGPMGPQAWSGTLDNLSLLGPCGNFSGEFSNGTVVCNVGNEIVRYGPLPTDDDPPPPTEVVYLPLITR